MAGQISDYRRATANGTQSILEGLFNPAATFEGIRDAILGTLDNDDFNRLQRTSSSMNSHLTIPIPGLAVIPPYLPTPVRRNQASLRDFCDERILIAPRAVGHPGGVGAPNCASHHGSHARVADCQKDQYRFLAGRRLLIHNFLPRSVCEYCRRRDHYHTPRLRDTQGAALPGQRYRYQEYFFILCQARIDVCYDCDSSQRSLHPRGLDGCTCYRDWYQRRWLCGECDARNIERLQDKMYRVIDNRPRIIQRGRRMEIDNPRPRFRGCPCGGRKLLPVQTYHQPDPLGAIAPQAHTPWVAGAVPHPVPPQAFRPPANHQFHIPLATNPARVQQCVVCCGYIVPPTGTRASTRSRAPIRPGTLKMLDSKGNAVDANEHGFPVTRRSTRGR